VSGFLAFSISFFLGYVFFLYFSHPNKKKNKVPRLKFWKIEILPSVKIHLPKSTLHIHHWVTLTAFAVTLFVIWDSFFQMAPVKGITIAGIIQGLRYKDRFRFRLPKR
jgi:hypothetical protein